MGSVDLGLFSNVTRGLRMLINGLSVPGILNEMVDAYKTTMNSLAGEAKLFWVW